MSCAPTNRLLATLLNMNPHGSLGKIHPYIEITTNDAANLLDGIVSANLGQMRRSTMGATQTYPILRGIQNGTVRYKRADRNEHWQTWDELVAQLRDNGVAYGDCEDFAAAVASELVYAGIPARTYVYKSGPSLYHVVVKTDRWGFLDPARDAGMEGNG